MKLFDFKLLKLSLVPLLLLFVGPTCCLGFHSSPQGSLKFHPAETNCTEEPWPRAAAPDWRFWLTWMQRAGLLPAAEGPWVVLWGVCARIGLYIQPTAAANPIGCSYRHFIVSALDTSPSLGTLVLRGRVDQKWSSGKTHDACRGSLTVDEWKLQILTEFVKKLKVRGQKGRSRKAALLKEQFT